MAYSALQFNANALYQGVNVPAHGFTIVGEVVRFNGANFVDANNTSEPNAEVVGIISNIPNVDQFFITQMGFISGVTAVPSEGGAFTPGTLYYLSSVDGELTSIKPTTVGLVELPCYIPYTATTGFFFASVGSLIESGAIFTWNTVNANTNMAVNNGYIVNGVGSINLLLPAVCAVGDIVKIRTLGTNGCVITQNNLQSVNIVDATSTVGALGIVTLNATNGILSGAMDVECLVPNTVWKGSIGSGIWTPA